MSNAFEKFERRLKGGEADETATQRPAAPSVSPSAAQKPHASEPEHRGYIAPRTGYVPAPGADTARRAHAPASEVSHPQTTAGDNDPNHPLHRHYRKRIRGVRFRWLGSGLLAGALLGILLTLLVSALVVTQFPSVLQGITGDPDVAVVIGENYLNRQAAERMHNGSPMTVANLQVTNVTLDLKPGNRLDLDPQFSADLILTKLNFNAAVKNQLSVVDGKLVISMVGDPQLGNINVPLDLLPFNLKDSTRQAVDKIDNDLIAAEINKTLENAAGSDFIVYDVTTTETGLTIRLKQK